MFGVRNWRRLDSGVMLLGRGVVPVRTHGLLFELFESFVLSDIRAPTDVTAVVRRVLVVVFARLAFNH